MYCDTKSDISYLVDGAHQFADTLKLQKVGGKGQFMYNEMSTWWPKKTQKFL